MASATVLVVNTAASSYNLTTLANVKGDLNIVDTSQDAYLTTLIARASAAVANYCNRVLPAETVTETFYEDRDSYPWETPGGVSPLQLTRWPAQSVASVVENDDDLISGFGDDFVVDLGRGQLTRLNPNGYACSWPAQNIVVNYVGGYTTIPADLEDACSRLVKGMFYARQRDPALKSENIPGVYSASYATSGSGAAVGIPADIAALLDNYRVPVVA